MRAVLIGVGVTMGLVACAQANNYDYDSSYDWEATAMSQPNHWPPYVSDFDWEDEEPEYPDCTGYDCVEHEVVVTYGLEDSVNDATVIIEAFDNAHFEGTPVASSRISPFVAAPGSIGRTKLWLKPGRYFLRAYLDSEAWKDAVPRTYGDMILPDDRPVGVLGALSLPQQLDIVETQYYDDDDDQIDRASFITLRHLFRDAESPYGTNAHLRFKLAYGPCASDEGCNDITPGTKVRVRLLLGDDLDEAAAFEEVLDIEEFQIITNPGQAELVTAELPEEAFVIYAFIDLDDNGFLDDLEPKAIIGAWDAPAFVKTKEEATPTLALTLE